MDFYVKAHWNRLCGGEHADVGGGKKSVHVAFIVQQLLVHLSLSVSFFYHTTWTMKSEFIVMASVLRL